MEPNPNISRTVLSPHRDRKSLGNALRNTKKRLINSVWAGYYKLKSEVETSPAMPVFETFAKRIRKSRGELPDVYTYDSIPEPLRIQIVQIMTEVLGDGDAYRNNLGNSYRVKNAYRGIVEVLRRERGVFRLPPSSNTSHISYLEELARNVLHEKDVEELLSAIELICRVIENEASQFEYRKQRNSKENSKNAIEEINHRFKEHGIGYEYSGELIRVDSELVHAEAVKPALQLLAGKGYEGAQQEFLSGYEHYRKQKYSEALADSLKALESTLKSIFDKRGWTYDADRDACVKLIQIALDHGLIPLFWQTHFSALRTTLEAGVPTARNRMGGHGQGAAPRTVPPHLVAYTLHMAASAIVFLVKSEEALP
ncbi:STM4504/CBY_0614 family protein [Roseibium aggregatum]|uniref:STM4504/CBY_0614 family protein n=1 Tax=Roseibium aggregatum TaxID=187304 RepID=UPI001AD91DC1|nr:hypothetical protein [Roseibium aggregatum]UFI05644.1 hypothetical protein ST40_011075 [Roseibium aggregatum]